MLHTEYPCSMPGFAYGDSVKTGDDKYVLAQFRHDAILGWVNELRLFLDLKELKWRDYRNRREYVQSNRALNKKVQLGLEQAELTIIDLPMYRRITLSDLIDEGAEAGLDFDLTILSDLTARRMISESPLGRLSHLNDFDDLNDVLPFTYFGRSRPLPKPVDLQTRAGGKLQDAVVLAARAHSMLSPSETMELVLAFGAGSQAPASLSGALDVVRSMGRAFDIEHEKASRY